MDITNLSSNWKALQQDLKKKQQTQLHNAHNGSAATEKKKLQHPLAKSINLKRKASNAAIHSKTGSGSHEYRRAKKARMDHAVKTVSKQLQPDHPTSSAQNANESDLSTSLVRTPSSASTSTTQPGRYIAIDCEMVGTTSITPFSIRANNKPDPARTPPSSQPTKLPEYSILARVSIVSYTLETIYDKYVLPPVGVEVSDYRTPWSGITAWHLDPENPITAPIAFEKAQEDLAALMDERILIGHAIKNDLSVLGLSHPQRDIRDTARHPAYKALTAAAGRNGKPGKTRAPGLKMLAKKVLGWDIQGSGKAGHDSVEDARATMELFRRQKKEFEEENAKLFGRVNKTTQKGERHEDGSSDELDENNGTTKAPMKKKKKKKKGK